MTGTIYLIPTVLGENSTYSIPAYVLDILNQLNEFIVENPKTTRRQLRSLGYTKHFDEVNMQVLNKKSMELMPVDYLTPLQQGKDMGIISEAGCPGVADPGANIVKLAHELKIKVVPLVGPSSILLALMASGLNGQSFTFNGYLPIKQPERNTTIKNLESKAVQGTTQIFMETPYRNNNLLKDVIHTCHDQTLLCVATNLTLENESIQTKTIVGWKKQIPDINRQPSIFLLG